jgi:gliding motility-associated-like protein
MKFKFFLSPFIILGICFNSFAQSSIFDFKTSVTGLNTKNFAKNINGKTHVANSVIAGNIYSRISKKTNTNFITARYFTPSVNLNTGISVTEGATVSIQSGQLHVSAPGTTSDTQIIMTVTTAVTKGRLFLDANKNNVFDGGDTNLGLNATFSQQDPDDQYLRYTSTDDAGTADSFVFSVTALGETINNQTFSITISPVNDAPIITSIPTDITVSQNIASNVNLSAATLSDPDAGASNVTLTIAAGAGTLSATNNGGVTVSGSGTGTIVLTGTVSALDTYINTVSAIKYTGSGLGDNATTLTVTLNDAGNTGSGGTKQDVKTVNVDILGPPKITSFTPLSGISGSSVTITGTNFNTTGANNIVYFGGVKATVTGTPTTTNLTVTVPAGASYSPISVLNTASGLVGYSSKPFLNTFSPNKSGFVASDLAAKQDVSTFQAEEGVATGDFNGDGKPDLMKSNYNGVSVYQNFASSGTIDASSFATKIDLLPTGTHPSYAAVGDLDGDGKPDIVVSNATDHTIVIYRNAYTSGAISASSFSNGVSFTTANSPRNIAIRDVDGDGKPEIIAACEGGKISIFQNTSTSGTIDAASFAAKVDLTTDIGPFSIAMGDLNADDKPDIAIINRSGQKVSVFQNTATAGTINTSSFGSQVDLTITGTPLGIAIADIDGDGKPDIIAGGSSGSIFRNIYSSGSISTGSFDTRIDLTLPFSTASLTTGDLNGDGKPDLLFGLNSGTGMSIFPNNAISGSISAASFGNRVDLSFGVTTSVYDALVADIDGDGKPDLVAGNANASAISIFRNALAVAPTTQAINVNFSATSTTATAVSWTNGNGVERTVFVKAASSGSPSPVDGFNYTANTVFGSGTEIASAGWYCVYKGTGTSVSVTGLSSATAYQVMVLEYNGTATSPVFQTATGTGNPANLTTLSNDATLSAMALSSGTLDPVFAPGTLTYAASVSSATSSITVTPTKSQTNATIEVRVNGGTYTGVISGSASDPLALNVGSNTVDVKITAQDATTVKTYTITVNKPSADATLSALTLSGATLDPAFTSGTITYAASVSNATTSITLTPTRAEGTATIKVNTVAVNSGSPSGAISLNVGANIITTEVTAGDGTTAKTYTVTITRAASADATLSAIALSTGTLNSTFTSGTTTYTASVPNTTPSITLTPIRTEGTATIKVNNTTVISGSASAAIVLNVGTNTIITEVTAGDGTTVKTYTLTVTRAASDIADLSALTITAGALSPVFVAATTDYTTTVPYTSTSIAITPAIAQANATVKVNGTTVSGTSSVTVPLNVGGNTITTIVTAQDGTTAKTYTIIVTRTAASTIANLSNLVISAGTLTPVFSSATTSYTMFVNNSVSTTTVTPTVDNAFASVKVNATTVRSQAASGGISLAVGVNTIKVLVTAEDGTTTKPYTVKITRLDPDQLLTDQSGNVTVNDTQKEVVITSLTQPISVTIPSGTTSVPTVDYSNIVSGGTGTVPQTTINSPLAKVEIPASTTISGTGTTWTGTISAPKISDYEFTKVKGQTITKGLVIEVGDQNVALTFTKAVRLVLYGQAGMRIARVHAGVYTEITTVGSADTQAAGDALAPDASFKINVGADLVIWTKGFSQFITFSQSVNLDEAVAAADLAELTAARVIGANSSQNAITAALTLPSAGTGGSGITWVSSQPSIVSHDGKIVNRPILGSGNATVTLTGTISKGTATETVSFTLIVLESPNQAPTLAVVADQTLCFTTNTQTIVLSGITAGPESGQLTTLGLNSSNSDLLNGLAVNSTTGEITYIPINGAGGTTTITVTVKDNGGTANGGTDTFSRTFTITINPLPAVRINSDLGTVISKGLTAQLTASGGISYSWSAAAGIISGQQTATLTVRPAVTTTYTVTTTNSTGCTSTQSITLNVAEDYKALDIPNILSPNGDGKNDKLVIKNLDMYPNNTLKIFDRSGRQVYTKQNYTNDWDGTSQGSPLTEETYYYIVDFGPGLGQLKGFVSIVR